MASTISNHNKQCYYLPAEGNDTQLLRQALSFFFNLAKDGYKGQWIAVNTSQVLENVIAHSKYEFGGLNPLVNSKQISSGNFQIKKIVEYEMDYDEKIYHHLPKNGKNRPLLALYPSEEFLLNLDMIPNISVMIVVPWVDYEIGLWRKVSNAKLLANRE